MARVGGKQEPETRPLDRKGSGFKATKKEKKRWERPILLDCGSHFLEACPLSPGPKLPVQFHEGPTSLCAQSQEATGQLLGTPWSSLPDIGRPGQTG